MAIYKRGETWWASFTAPNGQRIRTTTGTVERKAAQEYHDKLRTEYWRVYQLGDKPRHTWQTAVERWLEETTHKASRESDIYHLRNLHPFLGGKYLNEINRDLLDEISKQRKAQGVSNATVNRMLEILRAVLRRAEKEWGWLDKSVAIRMLPEPNRRVRWLSKDEVENLLGFLPTHLAEMVRFSLATGLRKQNVTHLEWSQIDLERKCAWIHPDQSKTKKAIPVPLNKDAMEVIRRQIGKHISRVFTFSGRPINQANTKSWRQALKKAGIKNFRWHDLRHTWATWHIQKGTPMVVLQELGGWSSHEMVQRYAHLSAEHLAMYADRLCAIHEVQATDTNLAQSADWESGRKSVTA